MPLVKGQAHTDPVTGLAGRIYTYLAASANGGIASAALGSPVRNAVADMAESIASAVIDELIANGVITVTVQTTDAGLQRDNTGGNPDTLGPASNKTLGGTIG